MSDRAISKFERRAIFSVAAALFILRIVELAIWSLVPKPTVTADGVRIIYGTVPLLDSGSSEPDPLICRFSFCYIDAVKRLAANFDESPRSVTTTDSIF